jgi:hypothetical protein
MKKQLLGLALVCSLSAMGMEQFGPPAHVQNVKPTLKEILIKKYIDRQPLTKAQQTYLNKTGKRAIAAGLAALGIGAAAIFGTMGYKYATTKPDPVAIFQKYDLSYKGKELRNALLFAHANNLKTLFSQQPAWKDVYNSFTLDKQFKPALAEIRGVTVEELP